MERLNKVFISYSYKDEIARSELISKLNGRGINPYVFPPITVSPNRLNSNDLIESILHHDSMIYIKGEYSDKSFWVVFERDYAMRAHKEVYSFDPSTMKIEKSRLPLLDLPIFPCYIHEDYKKIEAVFEFMRRRYIDLETLHEKFSPKLQIGDSLANFVYNILRSGNYIIFFLTSHIRSEMVSEMSNVMESRPERILFALLDKDAIKTIPSNLPPQKILTIPLYGDNIRSEKTRWHDLIVMIYWLILRNAYELV
ncbi:MAG: hypothetical protein JW776_05570 [Candidatus Lokiarchaeota archaeon]|nr:hypothetical protein [Candidatus Lokiarchaeota archaeon]